MEIQIIKISEEERKLVSDFIGEDIGNEIDFNRLMPVVEKIEAFSDFIVEVKLLSCRITRISELFSDEPEFYIEYNGQSKMDCVWLAVVEFIEWYNEEQSVKESDTTNDK